MRKFFLLTFTGFSFTWCLAQSGSVKNKLTVEFNENIATYSIVERLVADKQGQLFYINGKAEDDYLPMVDRAFTEMSKYDNTKIIQQTLDYLEITGNQQDLTYQVLLRANAFPQAGFKYGFEGIAADSVNLNAAKSYVEHLRQFYKDRNLQKFFLDNSYFIKGAMEEVRKNLPSNYINKMEKYYGETFFAFRFYINPLDAVPYEPEFWHGNGPKIKTKDGWIANMISSAYLPLKKQPSIRNYKAFGFDKRETINFLITHEFGHSFVNQSVESYEAQINKSADLLSSGLNEKMNPQGYGYWPVCVAEHLVRMGEIRIAETNGDLKKASELRKLHIKNYSFVLIPDFEKKIVEYEKNRNQYKTFADFVPRLLAILDSVTIDDIRKKLGLSIVKFTVSVELKVPNMNDDAYIAGNLFPLGNWNPQKTHMTWASDFTRKITFQTYPDVKIKFTRGSWETEGIVAGYEDGNNIELKPFRDSTYNFEILNWKK